MNSLEHEQIKLCEQYGAEYWALNLSLKLGISKNFFSGDLPLNGLRILPAGSTNGWYLWAGPELSTADDFFQPLHAAHLLEKCPQVLRYLGMAAGWRFLIAGEYEDVWYDESLLSA